MASVVGPFSYGYAHGKYRSRSTSWERDWYKAQHRTLSGAFCSNLFCFSGHQCFFGDQPSHDATVSFLGSLRDRFDFHQKKQQLPSKTLGKKLRRGATLIYGLLLLINMISSSIVAAAVTGMPLINSTTIGLLANAVFALAVSYLLIALGFWLAYFINKRVLIKLWYLTRQTKPADTPNFSSLFD